MGRGGSKLDMTMGSRSLLVTIVITVVIPSIWAGAIAGAQTQKVSEIRWVDNDINN